MFKFISIAVLGFIFYKMVMPKKQLDNPRQNAESEDEDYVDYEEID